MGPQLPTCGVQDMVCTCYIPVERTAIIFQISGNLHFLRLHQNLQTTFFYRAAAQTLKNINACISYPLLNEKYTSFFENFLGAKIVNGETSAASLG